MLVSDHHLWAFYELRPDVATPSSSRWLFLGFRGRLSRSKAPLFPASRLAAGCLPAKPRPEVGALLSGVISKVAASFLAHRGSSSFPEPVHDCARSSLRSRRPGLIYGSLLASEPRIFRGVVAYSSLAQMS